MRNEGMRAMILGYIRVEENAVVTHRASYLITPSTVVGVPRPFLMPGAVFGVAFFGFAAMFMDLLYAHEIVITLLASILVPLAAGQIGQLKLLSRDLRGSEFASVVWGTHGELNRIRARIMRVRNTLQQEAVS
ncbi:MAG: hypothetical protein WDZ83_20505 [Rhizobiaceae bacterium]